MESGVERRAARRFSMMLPLKVRFAAENGVTEQAGETRDVSFRGLYFLIEASVETGSSIEFVLTLPQQITLAGDVHIRCYARVLRVDQHNGRRGVAARIERYEFLPASA
jgi:hypothetical protein